MSSIETLEPGSFRDPAGSVFYRDGKVLRRINPSYTSEYEKLRDSGIITELISSGQLVDTQEVARIDVAGGTAYEVEHARIPFVSYPYEWSFSLLQAAAVFHLDLQIWLLNRGFVLRDATAFNIQFMGPSPVFIDLLSIKSYQDGEYWIGHRQFCEQFLNPLLLRSTVGVCHNDWFRGRLEGIPTADLRRVIPTRKLLTWNMLTQVVLNDVLQSTSNSSRDGKKKAPLTKPFPRHAYLGMLNSLRSWIKSLRPAGKGSSTWGQYLEFRNYTDETLAQKRAFVSDFCTKTPPTTMWDLGCNTGEFASLALSSGAECVVGFDYDQDCLDQAYSLATSSSLNFLPLYLDAANPSPNQGWRQSERQGLDQRLNADGLLALAFEHHLAIGRNIPLDQLIQWIISIAPRGVIEFVGKSDDKIAQMLRLREDIFADYTVDNFLNLIRQRSGIVRYERLADSDRHLFWYER